MKKSVFRWIVVPAVFCLGACGNSEETQEILQHTEDSTMPISYETDRESEQRLARQNGRAANKGRETGYLQERFRHTSQAKPDNGDPHFYNEQAESIAAELEEQDEIVLAQVYTTEKEIIAGLMIDKKYDDNAASISKWAHERIQRLAPDKGVQVYISDIITNDQKRNTGRHVKPS